MTLDHECRQCYGRGTARGGGDEPVDCPRCGGVGSEVTELGAEVLDFVRRHLRLPAPPAAPDAPA